MDSKLLQDYARDGYVVLHDVFGQDCMKQLKQLAELYIIRTLARRGNIGNAAHRLYRTENLLHDFIVPALIDNASILNFVEAVSQQKRYINEVLLYFSQPNGRLQPLHRDINHLQRDRYLEDTPLLAVQVPLIAFNAESGGTRLVSGSHKDLGAVPTLKEEAELSVVTPTVPLGGCLIRDARAWHGAGTNSSTGIRAMFTIAFSRDEGQARPALSSDLYLNLSKQAQQYVTAPSTVPSFLTHG